MNKLTLFVLGLAIAAALAFGTAQCALADGGPLPLCPPHSEKTCKCTVLSCKSLLPLPFADGSDPMPLCRGKHCK